MPANQTITSEEVDVICEGIAFGEIKPRLPVSKLIIAYDSLTSQLASARADADRLAAALERLLDDIDNPEVPQPRRAGVSLASQQLARAALAQHQEQK